MSEELSELIGYNPGLHSAKIGSVLSLFLKSGIFWTKLIELKDSFTSIVI
jgi:hypothetical protein